MSTAPVSLITPTDAKNLLILLARVPTITPAESDEFVALRAKLEHMAAAELTPDADNPLAPTVPLDGPVVVGPVPPRPRKARKTAKRRS